MGIVTSCNQAANVPILCVTILRIATAWIEQDAAKRLVTLAQGNTIFNQASFLLIDIYENALTTWRTPPVWLAILTAASALSGKSVPIR